MTGWCAILPTALVERARVDKLLGDRAIAPPAPEFVLEVKQLYQLFVAFEGDFENARLERVYPKEFCRPGSRVPQGTIDKVLLNLQRVANEIDVTE